MHLDKDIIALNSGLEPLLYSPERCQFVTPKENSNFKRNTFFVEYKGKRQSLKKWSEDLGVNRKSLADRIKRYGWSIEKAIETPFKTKNKTNEKETSQEATEGISSPNPSTEK